MFPVILFISYRYINKKIKDNFIKFIHSSSEISIVLSVASLIITTSIMDGFESSLKKNVFSYFPHVILTSSKGNINPKKIQKNITSRIGGVYDIVPIIDNEVIFQTKKNIGLVRMLGINKDYKEPILDNLKYEFSLEKFFINDYTVIIGEKLFNMIGAKLGNKIRILVPNINKITPVGIIPKNRLFTIINTFYTGSEADTSIILVRQKDAEKLLDYPSGNITGLRLYLKHPLDIDKINRKDIPSNVVLKDWRERKEDLFHAIKIEKTAMIFLISLLFIISSVNIFITLIFFLLEKKKEIMIFHSLGMIKKRIMLIFIIKGIWTVTIGNFVGSFLGVLVAWKINTLMRLFNVLDRNISFPIVFNINHILVIISFSFFSSLISIFFSLWRIIYVKKNKE
ncbi:hypothetical protein AOQ88_00585 [Candidatus Riesia sp. GBBU]|nr:hypothetical protein AOQ88_00585 [Candidatus Riesia sp. GBBU]